MKSVDAGQVERLKRMKKEEEAVAMAKWEAEEAARKEAEEIKAREGAERLQRDEEARIKALEEASRTTRPSKRPGIAALLCCCLAEKD